MTIEFYRQIFEKSLNIRLYENPSMRTDRHDEVNSIFFRDFANAPKNEQS
jgi:hypothetical protein